jgi:hypothetical protein
MAHLDRQPAAGKATQSGLSLSDDLRLLSDASNERDLQRVVGHAAALLGRGGGTCQCGITVVIPGGAPETIAATGDVPVRMDWLQGEWRQGPASGSGESDVVSDDLATDQRWPDVGDLAAAVIGVRSLLSVRVPVDADYLVMLSCYSGAVSSFDAADLARARMVVRLLAPAISSVVQGLALTELQPLSGGGGRVATALGLVMSRHRVLPDAAFDLLLKARQTSGGELFDVALEVLETGRLPKSP